MAKSKKSSTQKNKNKSLWYLAGAVIILIIAIQAVLFHGLYQRTDKLEGEKVKTLIIDAVGNMRHSLATDPATGKQYIPEARLVLPARQDITVDYIGDKNTLFFSDRANISRAISDLHNTQSLEATFAKVPGLQACSRQVLLQFKDDIDDSDADELRLAYTKQLADGRTAYLYVNNKCRGNNKPLLDYLKQVESY